MLKKPLFFALSAFRSTHPVLYYVLGGLLLVSPFIKVNTSAAYVSQVQVGAPWLLPFDSPPALCARRKANDFFDCVFETITAKAFVAGTIMEFRCEGCFELAKSLSLLISWDKPDFKRRYEFLEEKLAAISEWRRPAMPTQAPLK